MNESEAQETTGGGQVLILAAAWLAVGIPMLWGVFMTMKKASLLFR